MVVFGVIVLALVLSALMPLLLGAVVQLPMRRDLPWYVSWLGGLMLALLSNGGNLRTADLIPGTALFGFMLSWLFDGFFIDLGGRFTRFMRRRAARQPAPTPEA